MLTRVSVHIAISATARLDDGEARRRIVDEIVELDIRVAGVERQIHRTSSEHAEIERNDVEAFVDLHEHTIAWRHTEAVHETRIARAVVEQILKLQQRTIGGFER